MKKFVTLLQGVQENKEKKNDKYKRKNHIKSYKDKGKKSCYIAKDSDSSEEDEMVYIIVKDELDYENDKMALISHVSKNDTWIIDTSKICPILNKNWSKFWPMLVEFVTKWCVAIFVIEILMNPSNG